MVLVRRINFQIVGSAKKVRFGMLGLESLKQVIFCNFRVQVNHNQSLYILVLYSGVFLILPLRNNVKSPTLPDIFVRS